MKKAILQALSIILLVGIQSCNQKEKINEQQAVSTEIKPSQVKSQQVTVISGNPVTAKPVAKQTPVVSSISKKDRGEEREGANEAFDGIIERAQYEFDLVKDPATGKIPVGILESAFLQGKSLPTKESQASRTTNLNAYTMAGPDNLGGRTRAFAYDKRSASIMLAGSVSSGVMRSTNGGTSWTRVNGTNNIHNITCIAQDTRAGQEDNWYLGTGESLGNSTSEDGAFHVGFGVYKSTDNGLTWSRLAGSNNVGTQEVYDNRQDLITKVVVDPTNSNVYMACIDQIFRSTDGGLIWNPVLSSPGAGSTANVTDIVCTTGGVLYAAFAGTPGNGATNGVWKSTTGALGSWTQIAGSGSPAGWAATGTYGRVVLALAPSNQNILYALYTTSTTPGADFFKYDNSGGTWSANRHSNLPTEGFSTGNFDSQQGYDLVVAVKPNDENFVIIGGTNAYTSANAFATSSFSRIGGYATPFNFALYLNHHPDIHAFAFEPGSNIKMTCGSDGGIHVTTDVTAATVAWTSLNNTYQTYQYYYTAIDPTLASTKYIGGAQDNGTTYRSAGTNSMNMVYGGDGVAVGISAGNVTHYVGTQLGDIRRRAEGAGVNVGTNIKPTPVAGSDGLFITLFHLDPDNTELLYYANNDRLFRTSRASTVTSGTWTELTAFPAASGIIRCMATTRGSYTSNSYLYVGTDDAKILRLKDPKNILEATVPTVITPGGITAGSTVIGIAVAPANDDTVLAVISNYSAVSVFWTGNATAAVPTWYNVEGTGAGKLDLPSFRSCAIIKKGGLFEYYVGTSAGLFSTTAINGTSQATADATSWVKEGTGVIDQSVVTSLPVRHKDNTLLVGTHGNGMFHTTIGLTGFSWIGAISNDWGTAGNWSPAGVPTNFDNVTIPVTGLNMPVMVTGVKGVYNLTVEAGASITVTGTLQVSGTISNSGTLTATAGTIEMNGTEPQTIAGNTFATNTIANLKISNTLVTSAGTLNLTGTLSFGDINFATFNTPGVFTFKSNASGTAMIADLTNGGINTGNRIPGEVTVERFLSSNLNRAYRLLAPSVTTGGSKPFIQSNWQENTNNLTTVVNNDPNPGFGTHITGSQIGANGSDATLTGQGSLFTFNQAGNSWTAAANTSGTGMTTKTGLLVYIRGDRSIDLNSTSNPLPSSNTTLRTTGTIDTGGINFTSLASNGNFSLVTNPYVAPIKWNTINATNTANFENFYTYWDPNVGVNGGYVTVTNGGVVSPPAAGTLNIQSGQAFFVQTKVGVFSPTFTINEIDKASVNNIDVFRTTNANSKFTTTLFYNDPVSGRRMADGVTSLFDESFSASLDGDDAEEINNWDENIGIARGSKNLSIESRPTILIRDSIFLFMNNMKEKNYEFEFGPTNMNVGLVAELVDKYTGNRHLLNMTSATSVNFVVNSEATSKADDRFYVVFKQTGPLPLTFTSVKAYHQNAGVQVEWIYVENNTANYEVERSADGRSFAGIGTVAAISNNNTAASYNLFDASPINGVNYYRIKVVNKQGVSKYSSVVRVTLGKQGQVISIYPNPIEANVFGLQLDLPKGSYKLSITNKLGQEVFEKTISHPGGSSSQTIELPVHVASGIYQLKINGENINLTEQLIKK